MLFPLLSELVSNISLLISLVFIQYLIQQKKGNNQLPRQMIQGFLIGCIALILMSRSFELRPGLIFDSRTILLSISGLYMGALPTAVACAVSGTYRMILGGTGMTAGVLTILASGSIGVTARYFLMKELTSWNWKKNIYFGLSVQVVTLLIFYLFLPSPQNMTVVRGTLFPFLVIYPLITALVGKIMVTQIGFRKLTMELIESNDLYSSLFRDNYSVILLVDPETGAILDANKAAADFYGWSLEKLKTMTVYQINTSESRTIESNIRNVNKDNLHSFQAVHSLADGTCREVEVHSNLIQNRNFSVIISIIHDVTERIEKDRQLKKNEYQLEKAELIANFGHWELNLDSREFHASKGALNIYGVDQDSMDMEVVQTIPLQEYRPSLDKALVDLISGKSEYDINFRIKRPSDGKIREIHSIAAFNEDQNTVFGIIHDITEFQNAQNSILQEKERLDVTLHSIGDGVITTDERGMVQLMNPVAEDLTGWPIADARGKPLLEVFHIVDEYTRLLCPNPVDMVFQSGETIELANHTMLLARDGAERIIADSGAPIKDRYGKIIGTVLVFRDTTEKQMLHTRMQRAERLESLGLLAGGIAHDFNNLLTGIFGYIEMARTYNVDEKVQKYLESAFQVYNRTRDLTQQLLTFSKGNHPDLKTGDLSSLVRDSVNFSLSGSFVTCQIDLEEDLHTCCFDRNQIGQVLDNLLINAIQAMPEGGNIIVRGANVFLSKSDSLLSLKAGNYVCISVEDFGHGIPSDVLPRVFDPFFTTKELGSGLGLATCYSILEKHDGAIEVNSSSRGTTFRFYLPAVGEKPHQLSSEKKEKYTSGGHLLIMDDEYYIREILRHMLESMNFAVTEASCGEEVLEILNGSSDKAPFDAAILDLTIPGAMGGVETMKKIREMGYDFPLFASSGYSEDAVIAFPGSYGFTDSISKPFQKEELSNFLSRHFNKKSD